MNAWQEGKRVGMAEAMAEGGVYVPGILLRTYRACGLSDTEAMLLLQLMAYRLAEGNDFPTPEQLAGRMGVTPQVIGQLLQRLIKDGLLTIDERIDEASGIQYERYNWQGWLERAVAALDEEDGGMGGRLEAAAGSAQPQLRPGAGGARATTPPPQTETMPNLFKLFEREFGRPLSPMECETISGWLDVYNYPDELIRFALKEAVFAGKLHLRYIDRILIEWSRNRVTNPDEARAHARRFRGGGSGAGAGAGAGQ